MITVIMAGVRHDPNKLKGSDLNLGHFKHIRLNEKEHRFKGYIFLGDQDL